jgi:hypothetical protein
VRATRERINVKVLCMSISSVKFKSINKIKVTKRKGGKMWIGCT